MLLLDASKRAMPVPGDLACKYSSAFVTEVAPRANTVPLRLQIRSVLVTTTTALQVVADGAARQGANLSPSGTAARAGSRLQSPSVGHLLAASRKHLLSGISGGMGRSVGQA